MLPKAVCSYVGKSFVGMGGGTTSTPAKSVRCVVLQAILPRLLDMFDSTPSMFQRVPSQKRHLSASVQFSSMRPGQHSHLPATHLPRKLQ